MYVRGREENPKEIGEENSNQKGKRRRRRRSRK